MHFASAVAIRVPATDRLLQACLASRWENATRFHRDGARAPDAPRKSPHSELPGHRRLRPCDRQTLRSGRHRFEGRAGRRHMKYQCPVSATAVVGGSDSNGPGAPQCGLAAARSLQQRVSPCARGCREADHRATGLPIRRVAGAPALRPPALIQVLADASGSGGLEGPAARKTTREACTGCRP
jgi:hypothetical protein